MKATTNFEDLDEFINQEEKDFEEERQSALELIHKLKNNIDDDLLADFSSCSMRMEAIQNRICAILEVKTFPKEVSGGGK